jgi:hypothetical protein
MGRVEEAMTPPSWLTAIGTLVVHVHATCTQTMHAKETDAAWATREWQLLDALADLLAEHARQRQALPLRDLDAVFTQLKANGWETGQLG